MTSEQAANRQAEHENLVPDLVALLQYAFDDAGVRAIMGGYWMRDTRRVLERARP